MRSRQLAFLLGICSVLGCSGDPETSRLAVGQKVMAIPKNKEYKTVNLSKSSNGWLISLTPGTHCTVVADDTETEIDRSGRRVEVHVEDGEFKGMSGMATRWDLRPE